MPIEKRIKYLKLISIYLCYNIFLKIFFFLANDLIYAGYSDNMKRDLFFEWRGDSLFAKIITILSVNIIYDFFWLLPYTIMNAYIFVKLLTYLLKGGKNVYQYVSFNILKVYLFWFLIYLCSTGFGFLITETYHGLNGPLAPYGSLTITYLLLGNFVFVLLFVPLWNKIVKNWVFKTKL